MKTQQIQENQYFHFNIFSFVLLKNSHFINLLNFIFFHESWKAGRYLIWISALNLGSYPLIWGRAHTYYTLINSKSVNPYRNAHAMFTRIMLVYIFKTFLWSLMVKNFHDHIHYFNSNICTDIIWTIIYIYIYIYIHFYHYYICTDIIWTIIYIYIYIYDLIYMYRHTHESFNKYEEFFQKQYFFRIFPININSALFGNG